MNMTCKLLLNYVSLLLLLGCEKNVEEENRIPLSNIEVSFNSVISRVTDLNWDANDRIGVFMYLSGSGLSEESVVNSVPACYVYQNGAFCPEGEEDRLFYPVEEHVDFVAYYPLQDVSGYKLGLDISDQQHPSSFDLLCSDNLKDISATSTPLTLDFAHCLSKLSFAVSLQEGMQESDLSGMQIFIRDIPIKATFDLSTRRLDPEASSASSLAARVTDTKGEAIVYPGEARNHTVSVVLPSGHYDFFISPDQEDWKPGTKYQYTLSLDRSTNSPSLNAEISPWKDGEADSLSNKPGTNVPFPWNGSSSDRHWYKATDAVFTLSRGSELKGLADLVNSGVTFEGKTIRLGKDLDLGGHPFTSIGDSTHVFAGTFDGKSFHILGYLPDVTDTYVGLFGNNAGHICNVTLAGSVAVSLTAEDMPSVMGCLVGYNVGSIENCTNCASLTASLKSFNVKKRGFDMGGIAAVNLGRITGCRNYGRLAYSSSVPNVPEVHVGGIVGLLKSGSISDCSNHALLKCNGNNIELGGICGCRNSFTDNLSKTRALLSACDNYGEVRLPAVSLIGYCGGIIGSIDDWSAIEGCRNKGNVYSYSTGTDKLSSAYAGGIVGRGARCLMSRCSNYGKVTAGRSRTSNKIHAYAGGIIGYLSTDSELHANVHHANAQVECNEMLGGIVGRMRIVEDKEHTPVVYGCNMNQGYPAKWIGSEEDDNPTSGVKMDAHEEK